MSNVEEREREFHNKTFAESSRKSVSKFYTIVEQSRVQYEDLVLQNCRGKRVLEYGCGVGSKAFMLAEAGADVVGIDISDVAIEMSERKAKERGLSGLEFHRMDAQRLEFDDDSFDVICGSGILHHLELDRASAELARVLRPEGHATFFEPMGHNPFINWFRNRSPELRTPDEHPLMMHDVKALEQQFGQVDAHFHHLAPLATLPFLRFGAARALVRPLDAVDRMLFGLLPYLRRHAWIVVLDLHQPKAQQPSEVTQRQAAGQPA